MKNTRRYGLRFLGLLVSCVTALPAFAAVTPGEVDLFSQRAANAFDPATIDAIGDKVADWQLANIDDLSYIRNFRNNIADRRGWRRVADWLRRWIPLARVARGCGEMLGTHFQFVATDVGGCAIDIDTEPDYDASLARLEEWRGQQAVRAERLVGPLPLPASTQVKQ